MDIVAGIAHANAVALALLADEKTRGRRLRSSGRQTPLMVQRLKPSSAAFSLAKVISIGFVGRGRDGAGLGEARIVPAKRRRRDPCGFARAASVFNDDAHAVAAVVVVEIAQNPDAGMIHLHDGGDALGGSQPKHRNLRGIRHRIAIERDDFETCGRAERGCEFPWRCRSGRETARARLASRGSARRGRACGH